MLVLSVVAKSWPRWTQSRWRWSGPRSWPRPRCRWPRSRRPGPREKWQRQRE